MGKDSYRTLKVDPDVGAMLDRAKAAVQMQTERKVTLSGAIDIIIRGWAESDLVSDSVRGQVLAEAGGPCRLPDSHLAHVWRARDGRWWHCDGRVTV